MKMKSLDEYVNMDIDDLGIELEKINVWSDRTSLMLIQQAIAIRNDRADQESARHKEELKKYDTNPGT
jgi:hypothetical protein